MGMLDDIGLEGSNGRENWHNVFFVIFLFSSWEFRVGVIDKERNKTWMLIRRGNNKNRLTTEESKEHFKRKPKPKPEAEADIEET